MSKYTVTSVVVDEEIWLSFKNYVLSKYGKLRGYLSEELTRAIDYYLTHAVSAHTHKNEHIISKPNKRYIKLLTWLADFMEITHIDIEKFIVENFGVDKRTKRKYIYEFLLRMGFIKQKKALHGNTIYEVNSEKVRSYLKRFLSEEEFKVLGEAGNEKEMAKEEIRAFAVERYRMGDSLDEITEKISDFGLVLSKKAVRNIIRKGGER